MTFTAPNSSTSLPHLDALAERVAALRGWIRAAFATAIGAISVLGMPPFQWWPLLFITFPLLVWLLDGVSAPENRRRRVSAAVVGWCFGFGYFVAGLYWLGFAFLVEADKYAWLIPLAVVALPAALAIFTAAATVGATIYWQPDARRVLVLATAMFGADWLRGHILTGFPGICGAIRSLATMLWRRPRRCLAFTG